MPDFYEVVRGQRACRSFRPDPVAPAVLRRILEAATHAPSAENSQPWRFVVVTDPARRAQVGSLAERAWESGGREWSQDRLPAAMLAAVDAGARGGIAAAPVLVVVAVDTEAVVAPALHASVWPAVQNLLLAAAAEGLGSALTTLPAAYPRELAAVVGLPEPVRPMAVVPVGWPAQPLTPPRRRPVDDVAHLDAWGTPLPG